MSRYCISKSRFLNLALAVCFSTAAWAGSFGKVVSIGGHASDLALDEARGVLYVANFTANRIEVISLADHTVQRSMNVAAQPGSLALSPDGTFLVITHFGNFQAPNSPNNAITVINLASGTRQTFGVGAPPLGVAFGLDNRAFIATQSDFVLFDPVTGATELLESVTGLVSKTLPQPAGTLPDPRHVRFAPDAQRRYDARSRNDDSVLRCGHAACEIEFLK